jgi:hypothetical protein
MTRPAMPTPPPDATHSVSRHRPPPLAPGSRVSSRVAERGGPRPRGLSPDRGPPVRAAPADARSSHRRGGPRCIHDRAVVERARTVPRHAAFAAPAALGSTPRAPGTTTTGRPRIDPRAAGGVVIGGPGVGCLLQPRRPGTHGNTEFLLSGSAYQYLPVNMRTAAGGRTSLGRSGGRPAPPAMPRSQTGLVRAAPRQRVVQPPEARHHRGRRGIAAAERDVRGARAGAPSELSDDWTGLTWAWHRRRSASA